MALEILLSRARDESDPPEARAPRRGSRSGAPIPPASFPCSGLSSRRAISRWSAPRRTPLGQLADSASAPALATLLGRFGTTQDADIRASRHRRSPRSRPAEPSRRSRRAPRSRAAHPRDSPVAALGLPADSVGLVEESASSRAERQGRAADGAHPDRARIITIAFDHARAPVTVESFVSLARAKFFDGIAFHRVVPNFVAQDGCPRGDGWGGPATRFLRVQRPVLRDRHGGDGAIGKDTGGSQWFVTLSPQAGGSRALHGVRHRHRGMDVVERIMPGDRIVKVTLR